MPEACIATSSRSRAFAASANPSDPRMLPNGAPVSLFTATNGAVLLNDGDPPAFDAASVHGDARLASSRCRRRSTEKAEALSHDWPTRCSEDLGGIRCRSLTTSKMPLTDRRTDASHVPRPAHKQLRLGAAVVGTGITSIRCLWPEVLFEQETRFRIGGLTPFLRAPC